ncbi:MAG TPA: hypothetical protein VGH79_06630 [Gaiellaceae bacterium]|jgi:hypothetical protein
MSDHVEAQIRLGLRLLAEDIQPASEVRAPFRPRFLALVAAGLAVVIAAAVLAVTDPGGSPTAPRFVADTFNYQPGDAGSQAAEPALSKFSVEQLSFVAAASTRDAWIVGSVAWRWNGTAWRNVPLPRLRGDADLESLALAADGEAWIVGRQSRPSDDRAAYAVAEHWDGTHWRLSPLPNVGISNLFSVSASGRDDVWVFGESFRRDRNGKFPAKGMRPLLLHWDGSHWSRVALPWAPSGLVYYGNVVATAPTDVWVLRNKQIEHWDGTTWQAVPAPFGPRDPFRGFSASSADDAWAVGSFAKRGHSKTLAAHWNGNSWQIAQTPNGSTDSDLTDVAAVSPDDAWAVGRSRWEDGHGNSKILGPLFEHWDGRSWKVMPGVIPAMWEGFPSLAAAADGSAWAIGSCYLANVVARWNGSTWTTVRHPQDHHWTKWATREDRRRGFPHCRVWKR